MSAGWNTPAFPAVFPQHMYLPCLPSGIANPHLGLSPYPDPGVLPQLSIVSSAQAFPKRLGFLPHPDLVCGCTPSSPSGVVPFGWNWFGDITYLTGFCLNYYLQFQFLLPQQPSLHTYPDAPTPRPLNGMLVNTMHLLPQLPQHHYTHTPQHCWEASTAVPIPPDPTPSWRRGETYAVPTTTTPTQQPISHRCHCPSDSAFQMP